MSTAVFEVATSLPDRIAELNRLLDLADSVEANDEPSYNTLCRACCVLIASHLEGFLKDVTKSLVADLNFHLKSFSRMPAAMKNAFCRKIAFFEGVEEEEVGQRVKQLIAFFDNNSISIDMSAFSYKETANKNPSGDVVESTLQKLGVPAVLSAISGGLLDAIFRNDHRATYLIKRDIKRFRGLLFNYPYGEIPEQYGFGRKMPKAEKGKRTLWHTFIGEVMGRRHTIVHGDTMVNDTTTVQLRSDVEKLDVLMHAIMYAAVSQMAEANGTPHPGS